VGHPTFRGLVLVDMKMNLEEIKTLPKDPNEPFLNGNQSLDFKLVDFWAWNQSDLIENRNRGILAEFLVKQALDISRPTRLEWDTYDLETTDGWKIEVKSAAYIQAWKQAKLSSIVFDIRPTRTLLDDNNYSTELSRQADIYIFCLLHHKDQTTINPLDLKQWTFFIVATSILDEKLLAQKTVSISTIQTLPHEKCGFHELKSAFERASSSASKEKSHRSYS
jgi:hypothetical protein